MALEQPKVVLSFEDKASAEIKKVQSQLGSLNEKQKSLSSEMFKGVAAWDLFKSGIQGATKAIKDMVLQAGKIEQTTVSFTTLLGNMEDAIKFQKDLQTMSAKTPFELEGINKLAISMLAVGNNAEDAMIKIEAVGNASSAMGKGQEGAERIALALNQMSGRAKVSLQEFMQLNEVGINGFKLLANATGESEMQLRQWQEEGVLKGKETAELLYKQLQKEYFGAMEAQSKTLNGKISTLKDTIALTGAEIGKKLVPAVNSALTAISNLLEKIVPFIEKNQDTIKTFGQMTVAIAGLVLGFKAFGLILGTISAGLTALTTASGVATAGMTALKVAMLGIPAALTIAIALVGFALVMNQINALKREIAAQYESEQALYDIRDKAIKQGSDLIKSGDEDLIKYGKLLKEKQRQLKQNQEEGAKNSISAINQEIVAMKKKLDESGKLSKAQDIMNGVVSQTVDETKKLKDEQDKARDSILGAAEDTKKAASSMKNSIKDISDAYDNLEDKASDSLKTIKDKLEDLTNQRYELSVSFGETKNQIRSDYASAFVKQQDKIQEALQESEDAAKEKANLESDYNKKLLELNNKLAKAETEADKEEFRKQISDLTIKSQEEIRLAEQTRMEKNNILNRERQSLEVNKNLEIQYANEIAEAKRIAGLTDFERTIEEINKKKALAEKEYADKQIAINNQIALEEEKAKKINLVAQSIASEMDKVMSNITKMTEKSIDAQISKWKDLGEVVSQISSAKKTVSDIATGYEQTTSAVSQNAVPSGYEKISGPSQIPNYTNIVKGANGIDLYGKRIPGRANGGYVNSGDSYLVGENGPERFVPSTGGFINKNGNGIVINMTISNNKIMNERDAEDFGNLIINKLKKSFNL